MKLKYKFVSPKNLLVFTLFLVLVYKIDFPRKLYNLISLNYDQRINKIYGYCSDYSAGFINDIYNKYEFDQLPEIIKYTGSRNPYWIIPDIKNKSKTDYIFIKYNNNNKINLRTINNSYIYEFSYSNFHKIPSNLLFLESEIDNLNRIDIYENEKKIFELNLKNINREKAYYKIKFNEEIKNHFLQNFHSQKKYVFKPIYKNFSNKITIDDMSIHLINKYDLKDFKVIDQYENCYYAKKL
tara:strand:- start:125 stop:844 length:720 start_codon:yes stop_codon:yes gene_type:complete